MPSLRVLEVKATNLPNVEKKGTSDPYASLQYQGNTVLQCVYNEEELGLSRAC